MDENTSISLDTKRKMALALTEHLIFTTLPLRTIYEQVRIPVVLRTPGCWFAGLSGQGKSTAAEYCAEALRREFPRMPVVVLNLHVLPANASRSIPIRLLEILEHKVSGGETTRIKMRVAKALAEDAMHTPLNQCVLILDESQALRSQDLFFLKDLSNDVAGIGPGLITVMFGESPKMESLANKTREGEDFGLAERFFVRQLNLCRYETEQDWESLLVAMDKDRFPEFDDRTVPEQFLADAQGHPLSLKQEAEPLWKAIKQMPDQTVRRIFTGIRWWILHAGICRAAGKKLPDDLWKRAMAYGACVD